MPTPTNDAPPLAFGDYLVGRLSRPIEASALGVVYMLFLLVGGWIPLWAGHVITTRAMSAACSLVGATWLARGTVFHAVGVGLPGVILFLGMLRCDHDRLVRAWRATPLPRRPSI
ncbi:Cc1-like splicing factor domain-containing protein [Pandoravirus kuranda]|uniref:Cc1-like splicing factor domain-containing protein n=1 Tax=Pandoravirus kuranda TaxID=3019033 RepID=A0AA95ENL6_9VIRU|nr:Cc1-like splicing factor domain-containing protein [Pandoravirus kuranda]